MDEVPQLDDKLRHLVPPGVRALEAELKNTLQAIVSEEYTKIQKCDEEFAKFLKQFGLPEALHSITASSEIPDDVWEKVAEFQKKGAS